MVATAADEAHVGASFAGQPVANPAARVEVVSGGIANKQWGEDGSG